MATVPIREVNDPFGHKEANQPFAIEDAVVDGGGNLDVTIGDGRIAWGDVVYELNTGGTGTIVTEPTIPAAVDDYYVYIDFADGVPALLISTTAPSGLTAGKFVPLGYVTTTATPTVDTITDLRTMLPSSSFFRGLDGSAGDPIYGYASEVGTGMYLSAPGVIGFSVGGAEVATIDAAGFGATNFDEILLADGTLADPSLAYQGNPDLGWFRQTFDSTDGVSLSVDGSQAFHFTKTGDESRLYAAETNEYIVFDGGDDDIGFVTSNVQRALIDGNGLTVAGDVDADRFLGGAGSAAAPVFRPSGDNDTGMYASAGALIEWSIAGTREMFLNSAGLDVTNQVDCGSIDVAGDIVMNSNQQIGNALGYMRLVRSGTTDTLTFESNDQFQFTQGGTQRILINPSGDFFFTDQAQDLHWDTAENDYLGRSGAAWTFFENGSSLSSTVNAGDFVELSDERAKANKSRRDSPGAGEAAGSGAASKVRGLEVLEWDTPNGRRRVGFSAQSAEAQFGSDWPGLYETVLEKTRDENGEKLPEDQWPKAKAVSVSALLAEAVLAIHELTDRVEALESA